MQRIQTSDTAELAVVLALGGGFMDAYSYLCRGRVFANAQTGNMLLLGVNLSEGNWAAAVKYCAPVLAFWAGIVLAESVRHALEKGTGPAARFLHWRQLALALEILSLAAVSFIPQELNLLANCITSLACGVQVESFRKVRGNGIATTMCIGNLRSGTESLCQFMYGGEPGALRRTMLYYGVILCFLAGAIVGNFSVKLLGERSMLVCCGILLAAFLMMFREKKAPKVPHAAQK